jgi:cell wall-associated NlpC family hydrolase
MMFLNFRHIKLIILVLTPLLFVSCAGLREHIRERQLETHGPPRSVNNNRRTSRVVHRTDTTSTRHRSDTTANRRTNDARATAGVYKKYSEKWNVQLTGSEDSKFIEEIDTWLGTPYVYGGESKKGTDCSGMIQTMYKNLYGISLNRSANDMQKDVRFIDLNKARLGDILFFKINFQTVGHVALYLGNRRFIHATVNKGVMISCLDEDYYSKRYYKCGRIVAMEK